MCGIAGIVRAKGPVHEAELASMASALQHRGPDGHGTFRADAGGAATLGLVHNRLAVVDLSPRGRSR